MKCFMKEAESLACKYTEKNPDKHGMYVDSPKSG